MLLDKNKPSQPSFIIDLTDEYFHVCSITQEDAIHAKKDEISRIFKVRNSLFLYDENFNVLFKITIRKLSSPKQLKNLYVLANNESEKDHYINMISDRLLKVQTSLENGSIVSIENVFFSKISFIYFLGTWNIYY